MESNGNKISKKTKQLKQKRRTKRDMNQNGNGFNATIFVCSIEGRLKVERAQTKAVSHNNLAETKSNWPQVHREEPQRTPVPFPIEGQIYPFN